MLDEPSGITNEITPIKPTGSISLTDYIDDDTIYLFGPKVFTFDIEDDIGNSPFQGHAYFDNTLFYSFNTRQGQFSLPESSIKTGQHKLRLTFGQLLNDQSLITRFKDIYSTIFKEWVVIIDVDPPPPFEISTQSEDGYLKYTWPEYKKSNFVNYSLTVVSRNQYKNFLIIDPSKNYFVDSLYIDGTGQSSIEVNVRTLSGNATANASISEPPIQINITFNPEDTTARLIWSKPTYYGALGAYTVSDEHETLTTINAANDTTTTFKVDGAFPNVTYIRFKMLDKSGTEVFLSEKSIDFFAGLPLPTAVSGLFWYYSKSANKYIMRSGPTISIFDESFNFLTTRTIEGNAFNGMSVSWPGFFLHYIGLGNTLSQLDLVNNNEKSMPVVGEYMPQAYIGAMSGASNQLVSFYALDNDHVNPAKEIVGLADMQANTVLQQENSAEYATLSDDGRYTFVWPKVYSVNAGVSTYLGTIPNNYYFRWFRGDNTDEIITTQYDAQVRYELKTIIVGSSDLSILRSFDPPEPEFSLTAYDPATKTLLYTKPDATRVYLVNIDTGQKTIFKARGGFNTPLVNGRIIIGGRYIKAI